MSDIFGKIADAVYEGDEIEVAKLADEVISQKLSPLDAIQKGGVVGLERLGKDFEEMNVFLPELMLAGDAMKVLIEKMTPFLETSGAGMAGKVVIGCAKGDLHDIGKTLVSTQLAVHGFDVIDLGVDVSTGKFIQTALEEKADIIAMSSLMTTSANYMEDLVVRLEKENLKSKFKVIVGGGPIDQEFAKRIKADGYARSAFGAVRVCKELMKDEKVDSTIVDMT